VKPSKMPRRAETNIEQNESVTEAENFQATVQTMLDRLGEKHPSSATPQIISPLKTRHSDERLFLIQKEKTSVQKKIEIYPNWGGKRPGQKEYPSVRREEKQSEGYRCPN